MIEITHPARSHEIELVDAGEVVRGLNGAGQRQNRLGGHYKATFMFPPMRGADGARVMKSRLVAGSRQVVKMRLPLAMSQGIPGTPVVDGAGQSGHSVVVRGLTPNYAGRVGWWLNIIHSDGTICLHDVAEPFAANGEGEATIAIEPALRLPYADGAVIELAHPEIAGFIEPRGWGVSVDFLTEFQVTIEEAV